MKCTKRRPPPPGGRPAATAQSRRGRSLSLESAPKCSEILRNELRAGFRSRELLGRERRRPLETSAGQDGADNESCGVLLETRSGQEVVSGARTRGRPDTDTCGRQSPTVDLAA